MKRWLSLRDVSEVAVVKAAQKGAQYTLVGANELLAAFFEVLSARVIAGEQVHVPGFGVFAIKTRKARVVRHPKTRKLLELPSVTSVYLRPSKHTRRFQ
jgi:nucleoid DNA-binding protein